MDKTDRISFSKSFDLASQNKLLKDSGQVDIAKTINMGRFFAGFGSILQYSGDHLEMIRACFGGFPGLFELGKKDLYKFPKNSFFFDRWVVCRKKS